MNEIQFEFLRIEDEQYATLPENFRANTPIAEELGLQFAYDPGKRLVLCKSAITAQHASTNIFLRIGLSCVFRLSPDSWDTFFKIPTEAEQPKLEVRKPVLYHFGAFTVGTLRGYAFARTAGFHYRPTLPPINVVALVDRAEEIVGDFF